MHTSQLIQSVAAFGMLFGVTQIAHANLISNGSLYGQSISTAVYFPSYGTVYPTTPAGAPYTVIAGSANPDLTFFGSARFDVDFQPDKIVIKIDDQGCCTVTAPFNGISFKLNGSTFATAVLESTNIANFGASRVFLHDSSEILVDIGGGLNLDPPNSTIVIGVSAIPEPASVLLFTSGLAVLLWAGRKRSLVA